MSGKYLSSHVYAKLVGVHELSRISNTLDQVLFEIVYL